MDVWVCNSTPLLKKPGHRLVQHWFVTWLTYPLELFNITDFQKICIVYRTEFTQGCICTQISNKNYIYMLRLHKLLLHNPPLSSYMLQLKELQDQQDFLLEDLSLVSTSGQNKEKLAGRVFLLHWENDRAAIAIISWGFRGGMLSAPQRVQGRALVEFVAKPQKMFGIFFAFPHENVLNKNQFERNKSHKYTSSSQWSRLLLDFQQ